MGHLITQERATGQQLVGSIMAGGLVSGPRKV